MSYEESERLAEKAEIEDEDFDDVKPLLLIMIYVSPVRLGKPQLSPQYFHLGDLKRFGDRRLGKRSSSFRVNNVSCLFGFYYGETFSDLEQQNSTLKAEINSFKRRIESIEKMSRSSNVEIQAVPEKRSENVLTIVKNLYTTVNLPMSDCDIIACRRVAKMSTSSNRPRNILVTLPSVRHRDNLISSVKRYNKTHSNDQLNSEHVGVPGEKSNIYVAEHLSAETKELHAATRQAARGKYKYVWVKFGNIYVRKDDSSPVILIKNKDSLLKLM
ncbi:uncharacterized protein LOC113227170 [Hyposmocoma kahamanoa]|uniref:uncharacterized protein LOC113227170 n=1 Tax=Hyposmocoma kahamanoa TaxID=1477025 RepID=UPI000E6D804B|nr:uncharacterized protein LOC113227170 [Hyposmocoma kahamanoa]